MTEPCLALVIGTYGSLPYVHLHLESWRRFCPAVPCLVADDCSVHSAALADLAGCHGAEFVSNPVRLGHQNGDLSVFQHGLLFARRVGADVLVKMSRRWLPVVPWEGDFRRLLREKPHLTYSGACSYHGFGFRTECTALAVPPWLDTLPAMRSQLSAAGGILNEVYMHQYLAAPVARGQGLDAWHENWPLLGTSRRQRREEVLWHETHQPREYAALARAWGLDYPDAAFQPD